MNDATPHIHIERFYQALGLPYRNRGQLAANAGNLLLALHSWLAEADRQVTTDQIDAAVVRLAESDYGKKKNRMPSAFLAGMNGAFAATTYALMLGGTRHENVDGDIRSGLTLIETALHHIKVRGNDITPDTLKDYVRDLAIVSSICKQMTGFNPHWEIKRQFQQAGDDADKFAERLKSPTYVAAVRQIMKNENI